MTKWKPAANGQEEPFRQYGAAQLEHITESIVLKRAPKQLNVQQQYAHTEDAVRKEATYWRVQGVPAELARIGEARGVQWDRSIILRLLIDFPGMPTFCGNLVTQDRRFIAFEIDATDEVRVEQWEDITGTLNFNERNKGIGVGYGALALKILRELSTESRDQGPSGADLDSKS